MHSSIPSLFCCMMACSSGSVIECEVSCSSLAKTMGIRISGPPAFAGNESIWHLFSL